MFKKLKDKIAEEVKISPLKLQTSVQQLAHAMVSPTSSVNSIQESRSNDNFCIAEESEVSETPRNSPEKEISSFHPVDLREDVLSPPRAPTTSRSRRSSASSMISDASSLFPLYESPSNAYNFQSDLESTSEIEEIGGSTSHLQGISKEQLLMTYRKTQSRYHKYKGRYVDLARHFRELERNNNKIKTVLTETQDRALRKIGELKEQCLLEQKAKAHLEEALRNDLEEKDHLIKTLKTKVALLKDGEASIMDEDKLVEEQLIDFASKKTSQAACQTSQISYENSLQDKILEAQVSEYQEKLNELSKKLLHLEIEKREVDGALVAKSVENEKLKLEVEAQRKREEEAALSLAENKMQVHRELEAREEEAKKLKSLLVQLQEDLRNQRRANYNGQEVAFTLSESGSGLSHSEEPNLGSDITQNSQPINELTQLKEVLRGKYKEVEDLVAENARLRASLHLMSSHEIGGLGRKSISNEHFTCSESEVDVFGSKRSKKTSPEETDSGVNSVRVQSSEGDDISQEAELKNLSDEETLSETSELNQRNIFSFDEPPKNEAEIKRRIAYISSEMKGELKRMDDDWRCKYSLVKEELDKLLVERDEMSCLLKCEEVPSNWMDYYDERSMMHSLASIMKERKEWKTEAETAVTKWKDLDAECEKLNGILEVVKTEKIKCMEEEKKESSRLNREVEGFKSLLDEKEKEKVGLKAEIVELRGIKEEFERVKGELESLKIDSEVKTRKMRERWSSDLSEAVSTVQEKEKELEQIKRQLELEVSLRASVETECQQLRKELMEEKESKSFLDSHAKVLNVEFSSVLRNGKSILRDAQRNIMAMEKENEELKARCESFKWQEEIYAKEMGELKEVYERKMMEMQEERKNVVERTEVETQELKRILVEAQDKASEYLEKMEVLKAKKIEMEGRLIKMEKELKAMRESEEKTRVESEEMVNEQAAMRRSWEMQRDQIESMSKEIEALKKTEDGLIRTLKEVKEESKNKDAELKSLAEEAEKERTSNIANEEKMKNDVMSLKKLIEEHSMRECEIKKEMGKFKDVTNEWKTKNETQEKEIESLLQQKRKLEKKLDAKEEEASKMTEEADRMAQELSRSSEKISKLESEFNKTCKEADMLKNLVSENEEENNSLKRKNEELIGFGKALEEKIRLTEMERDMLKECKLNMETQSDKLEKDKERYEHEIERSKEEMGRVNGVIEKLTGKCYKLEEEVRMNVGENERLKEELSKMRVNCLKEESILNNDNEREVEVEKGNREDGKEYKNEKEIIMSLEEELRMVRDEAWKELEYSEKRIKMLEEKVSSSEALEKKWKEEEEILKKKLSEKEEKEAEEVKRAFDADRIEKKTVINAQLEASKGKDILEGKVNEKELEEIIRKKMEFEDKMFDRERELKEQLLNRSEKLEEDFEYVRKQLTEEIKGIKKELILKSDAYDNLLKEHNQLIDEHKLELEVMRKAFVEEKEDANEVLKDETCKWMAQISELEEKHKKAIVEMQRKWESEKKDLEKTSKVAVAAVESGTGSMAYLKRQIQAQTKELSETKRKYSSEIMELRHLLSLGRRVSGDEKLRIDDSTELEYLRNILYEYMMGKEPMVLARVIAAVVKFDDEQTKKILTKEEQKQTLLGQFGLT